MSSADATLLEDLRSIGERTGVSVDTVVVDDRDDWEPVGRALAPGSTTVAEFVEGAQSTRGAPSVEVAAMLAWKAYSYVCAQLVVGSWAAHQRVPDLSAANTAIRFDDATGIPQLALVEPRIFVAHDDLAADHDHAVPLHTESLLSTAVSTWWVEHFEAAIERWRVHADGVRVGRRGLTAFAVSQATSIAGISGGGDRLDQHAAIVAWMHALPESQREMAPIVEQRTGEEWLPMVLRTACCRQYELDQTSYCISCNLLDDDKRTKLMTADGRDWRPVALPLVTTTTTTSRWANPPRSTT